MRIVVEHHSAAGSERPLWEPTSLVTGRLAAPYVDRGREILSERLATDVDSVLDEADDTLDEQTATLDLLDRLPGTVSTRESNTVYSATEAAQVHAAHSRRVESDIEDGSNHHRRTPVWLLWLGIRIQWIELAGALMFISYYFNVPILQPWEDWLGSTFALTVAIISITGQKLFVDRAARAHNHAREACAEGNDHAAEAAARHRTGFLAGAAVIAGSITTALILRGTATLGDAAFAVTAVMFLLAAITGLVMPSLAFLAVALDGSRISRERDGIAEDLDADLLDYHQLIDEIAEGLNHVDEIDQQLVTATIPDIKDAVRTEVDRVLVPYGFLRIQIGGLADLLPTSQPGTAPSIPASSANEIGTALVGAGAVDLQPLADRIQRLRLIRERTAALRDRLRSVPVHPWTRRSAPPARLQLES